MLTRRKFSASLSAGAAFLLTPLRAFGKSREIEIVHATVHQRLMESGGSYLFVAPQVRKFKAGDLVEVTIKKVEQ